MLSVSLQFSRMKSQAKGDTREETVCLMVILVLFSFLLVSCHPVQISYVI